MSENASAYKEKGNAFFKSGRLAESIEWYQKVNNDLSLLEYVSNGTMDGYYFLLEAAAPHDPIFPSNLSAALYELGDYLGCFRAICRAVEKASQSQSEHSSLLLRLSLRFAKTLSNGVRSGTIKAQHLSEGNATIDQLEALRVSSDDETDLSRAWKQWKGTEADMGSNSEQTAAAARNRLAALPIFRQAVDPEKEYHTFGQDDPMSIVHDWGPADEEKNPLDLNSLSPAQRSRLAFLFAGVGDARHVFGSIIGLHKAYKTLKSKSAKDNFRAHLTLLDIHPTPLARDLCIMILLEDLVAGNKTQQETEEIKATIFYSYTAAIVPMQCHKQFLNTVQRVLQILKSDSTKLPSWIHITPEAVPGIISSLSYWQKRISSVTVRELLQLRDPQKAQDYVNQVTNDPAFPSSFADNLHQLEDQKEKEIKDMVSKLPDAEIIRMTESTSPSRCPSDPKGRAEWIKKSRATMGDIMVTVMKESGASDPFSTDLMLERLFHKTTSAFVPPPALRGEGIDKLWASYDIESAKQKFTKDSRKEIFAAQRKAQSEIEKEWKPNISLFDPWFDGYGHDGYPGIPPDAFQFISAIQQFNVRHKLVNKQWKANMDNPSLSIVSVFFDAVVDALKGLKDKATWEVLQGDMCKELVKMRLGEDRSRPEHFPRKYLRMWLSNIPDYTHGPLNTAIYIVPNLEDDRHAAVSSNCMLNPGIWQDDQLFCHNYTLLTTTEVPRFLGCRTQSMRALFGLITLLPPPQPYPLPLSQLASREELTHWLARVLLQFVAPPVPKSTTIRVLNPNNLVSFLNLLIHLHAVGFPGHWLSEFLSDVLADRLFTAAIPYCGKLPIPLVEKGRVTTKRKVFLDPWKVDFENMLSEAWEALPFPVATLRTVDIDTDDLCICSRDEIGHYKVELKLEDWAFPTSMGILPRNDACVALFFMRPGLDPDWLANRIGDIVEGKVVKRGDIYVLTMVDRCDMSSGVIEWRMRKRRIEKMKRNGWAMVPIRMDAREAATTDHIPAKLWKEIIA